MVPKDIEEKSVIGDSVNLWSDRANGEISSCLKSLIALSEKERVQVCEETVGQAENKHWYQARTGLVKASVFK